MTPSVDDQTSRAWFDVIALSDGRAALLVGDVVEQGLSAAAVAGQVRAVLAPLLTQGHDLVAALERLSDEVDGEDPVFATTVCLAIVDPIRGDVQYSTSGHPPPLVVGAGGARVLRSTDDGVLRRNQPVHVETEQLGRDEVLVLHTDGLSWRTTMAVADGLAELPSRSELENTTGTWPADHCARTSQLCRATAAEMLRSGTRDDLAVLAAQSRPRMSELDLTVSAEPSSLDTVRQVVGEWLAGLRSSVEDGAGMVLAVDEAMANAVQHAFVGTPIGSVRVKAALSADGVLACSVRDDGRWLPRAPSRAGRAGRGLRLMARLCDRMQVSREVGGTLVELSRRLHHPVSRAVTADRLLG
ncbi:MAG: SpoIIE family protein phosphatase [Actinomycetota bacterium]|nr:SpoIIE family protein phosphatase [Actinomycetota bacterium]